MGNCEILQFTTAQFLAHFSAMAWAVKVKTQKIRLAALPLTAFARLLMTVRSPMPPLSFHLLAQVFFQLQG